MRLLRCVPVAAVLLLIFGASAARALPTAAQVRTAFAAMDTTGNDAINLAEWDRGSFALFHTADKNKNDAIDADELRGSNIAQDTFLLADTNHDGRLSLSEFMELRRSLFHIADIDRDDSLIYVEFELLVVMEQVGWTDRDHDGRIELSELRESLTKVFEQIDVDHDGKLTTGEAAYMPAAEFRAFDKNRDGQLTVDEFVAGYRTALLGG
jgi:Ca2+-binding EF-hand superfamily protein